MSTNDQLIAGINVLPLPLVIAIIILKSQTKTIPPNKIFPYVNADKTISLSIKKKVKKVLTKPKNIAIIIIEPNNAITIADLKIHSALKISWLPKALAVAPLIAPPNAPFDNMLVNIYIGKT